MIDGVWKADALPPITGKHIVCAYILLWKGMLVTNAVRIWLSQDLNHYKQNPEMLYVAYFANCTALICEPYPSKADAIKVLIYSLNCYSSYQHYNCLAIATLWLPCNNLVTTLQRTTLWLPCNTNVHPTWRLSSLRVQPCCEVVASVSRLL